MAVYKDIVALIFSLALLINAALFIPQAIRIWKEQTAKGISLITFFGFWLTQLAIVIHGLIKKDFLLTFGYLLSMVTCGGVIFLVIYFRRKQGGYIAGEEISLDEVIKQMPGHLYWKNKEGVFLGSNTKNWKEFGLRSLGDYLGKTDYDLFPKEQAGEIVHVDREVLQTGEYRIIEEISNLTDGTPALFLSHKVPLKNKHGEIIGVAGISLDITETRQKETSRLELLENIIALMPGHVYWINRNSVYQGCNDLQAKSAGLNNRKEIIGKRNKDLPWNYNAGLLPEALDKINQEIMDSGETRIIEEPAELQDGSEVMFLSSKVPMKEASGQIIGMVGISIDITEIKNTERALKEAKEKAEIADIAKIEFLSNMRHDLRTPFCGILGLSEIAAQDERDPEKYKILHCVVESAKELLDQFNEILDFIQSEEGKIPILEKQFDLRRLITGIIAIMKPSAKEKELEFKYDIDEDIPPFVIGDKIRTQRILTNLLSNAIKFTKEGRIELHTHVEKYDDKGVILRFLVKDTGIGIPEDKYNLIFEQFNRLTSSYSGVYSGKGLGLRMVKHFLDEIGGESHVKSIVNQGSTFTILIPYKVSLLNYSVERLTHSSVS